MDSFIYRCSACNYQSLNKYSITRHIKEKQKDVLNYHDEATVEVIEATTIPKTNPEKKPSSSKLRFPSLHVMNSYEKSIIIHRASDAIQGMIIPYKQYGRRTVYVKEYIEEKEEDIFQHDTTVDDILLRLFRVNTGDLSINTLRYIWHIKGTDAYIVKKPYRLVLIHEENAIEEAVKDTFIIAEQIEKKFENQPIPVQFETFMKIFTSKQNRSYVRTFENTKHPEVEKRFIKIVPCLDIE